MKTLSSKFNKDVGYSDHSLGINAALTSISMGAKILELHFTLDKTQKGADHELSVDPNDLQIISNYSISFYGSLGNGKIEPSVNEKKMRKFFRKSIHAKENIAANEKLIEKIC